jgi:hypothetical protein
MDKLPVEERVRAAALRRRSKLYQWLWKNRENLAPWVARKEWSAIADAAREDGIAAHRATVMKAQTRLEHDELGASKARPGNFFPNPGQVSAPDFPSSDEAAADEPLFKFKRSDGSDL